MTTTAWYGQRGEFEPDPFTYDPPLELRGRIAHYFGNLLNGPDSFIFESSEEPEEQLMVAFGVPGLPYSGEFKYEFQDFLYKALPRECIRAIEVLLNYFAESHAASQISGWVERVRVIIADVNRLFHLYQCGYQAEISQGEPLIRIIRVDSVFLHVETVKRPLGLLRDEEFSEAAKQFEDAVREWSEENYADAITDANSAFETVMKVILKKEAGKASELIRELEKRGYLPPYLRSGTLQLANVMEMLPILRDQESDAHGRLEAKGPEMANFARFAVNLAGSLIVFLVEQRNLRKKSEKEPI